MIWITLPKVGKYCLRPMLSERVGSKEMLRRIAVKGGYYNAGQYLHELKDESTEKSRLDLLRTPPSHYTEDQAAYFHEGFALGLDIAEIMTHPFGNLKSQGGSPMLPVIGKDVPA